ncbi:MAG: FAD-binding oxidoreductase [Ectothiorhodospiraceae bacterium]|nr:FAD-binding oxidoreductase [Chromatiales bacterium]MCP5154034.1 FAD-binding oxidoreductase [Ectothiorhodospiraceae bacterium]
MHADILIIGGGIIGSSIAWHLARAGGAGEVVVVERDPTYEHAATPRSNGGIRRLFSLPENIEMASYGLAFYRDFATTMADAGTPADIGFRRQGYLFVSDAGGAAQMEANFALQAQMGVEVELLTPRALGERFPSIATDGVDLAVLSDHDAWIDPHAALMGFRRCARALGVRYVAAEVTALEADATAVRAAVLGDGSRITADVFVNACGAWCAELVRGVGLELPVEPMSRESYYLRCESALEPLPFVKTETDLAFRPEGAGYIGGVPNWAEKPGWNFEVSPAYFDEVVWPALARRIPAMERIRLERSWRGHYARSMLDRSPILGPWVGGLENLVLANGFSGHGIMHAPATGRGIAEIILHREWRSIDLSCFGWRRVVENRPYAEKGIV